MRAREKTELSLEDVRRDALGQKLDAEHTANLLKSLARSGWVRELKAVSTLKGGRPARRWQVNPIIGTPTAETAETAQTYPHRGVSAVSAVSASQSVFASNGGEKVAAPDLTGPESPDDGLDIPASLRRAPPDRRPALGPIVDSLDDLEPPLGGNAA